MRLRFILSEIGIGLRRNLSMTISVILVTFVSLTFVGSAALLQLQIDKMKDDWYDKVEVSVFLCPATSPEPTCAGGEVTEDQKQAIRDALDEPEVAPLIVQPIFFETKEEAFASFKKQFGDQSWASVATVEDMNSSFRIKLTDPSQYQVVADVVSGRQGVESVQDQRRLFDRLFLVIDRATLLTGGLAAVMLIAAVLLITTTIRLSALSRKRETGIMRLVGASTMFIQLPFMLEGAIAATIGSLMAVGGLWLGVQYLVTDWLGGTVSWIPYVTTSDVLTVAPLLVASGILLAAISSLVTLSRYTKV
ncbi:MAG: permease-like cell division protein FtsX [Cellulomonas sp.]|uniref:Cell division protein FtsX n=1 Tax=Cellulomonas gelida TaxID=1712 RepID=A0A4Y3KFD8_9CELL|nr:MULTISPECIES: permease-like cell division protein FtsX [Cellulomonas]KMM44898.1 cell division protein FtsX [Cellulomonas sp. A375-1]MCR6646844.1 permease-like cell division protein FtsX [Cellulomonas sp.]MCR6706361.1 permease-like cell division protein FtsX [Cellulomonas sp.]GEA83119.1 cell division protein FtsX [Cellulomonas gelida]GGL30047.1 cell division protein FtsX [Cellulomonas gelida]